MSAAARLLGAALLAVVAAPSPCSSRTMSAKDVISQFEAALNAGNIEACMAWMAADGKIEDRMGKTVSGREDLRAYLDSLAAHRYRTEAEEYSVNGANVSWDARVAFDDLEAMGVESVKSKGEAVVRKGKIASYTPAFFPGSVLMMATAASRSREGFVRRMIEDVYNSGRADAAEEYFSDDFIDHSPLPESRRDIVGIKDGVKRMRAAFADLKVEIEDVVSSEGLVIVRSVMRGRHEAAYLERPPTYHAIEVKAVEMYRISEGKIVERWGQRDDLELMLAIGKVVPADREGQKKEKKYRKSKRVRSGGVLGWFFDLF